MIEASTRFTFLIFKLTKDKLSYIRYGDYCETFNLGLQICRSIDK